MNASAITGSLFIASRPQARDVEAVKALGVNLVLNMNWSRPAPGLNQPPLRLLTLRTFDSPLLRMPLTKLRTGVEAALPVLDQGVASWSIAGRAVTAAWPWPPVSSSAWDTHQLRLLT